MQSFLNGGSKINSEDRHGYALIVGISNYQDIRIPKLDCTVPDAEAVFDLLTDPEMAGFEKKNVKILLDEEGTLNKIKDAISNWLFKNADEESTVIIFFAGHGGVEEDRFGVETDHLAKYLLPYDTLFDNFSASALSNSEFNMFLRSIKSRRLVVFMDSCYSGGVTKKARDVKIIEDPYEKMAEGEGRLVIAASQPDQRSFEDRNLGHGVFTNHLLEALSGAADSDNDGYVSAMEVYRYLSDRVPKTAMQLAGGIQEPVLRGDLKTDFMLTVNRKKVEEIEKEKVRKKRIKKLSELYHDGKIEPWHYELSYKLINADYGELSEEDKKVFRSLEDLLSDEISVSTFLHDFEIIKGEKGSHIPAVEEARAKEDEKKKRIIKLTSDAEKLFEAERYEEAISRWEYILKMYPENRKAIEGIKVSKNFLEKLEEKERRKEETGEFTPQYSKAEQFKTSDIWKWGSMFACLAIVFFTWNVGSGDGVYLINKDYLQWFHDRLYWSDEIFLIHTIWSIFAFPLIVYFMYKERQETIKREKKIKYLISWILMVYLLWILDSFIAGYIGYLYGGFVLNIPAFIIDGIYVYSAK